MANLNINEDIREEYSKHSSIYKTAKILGIQVAYVKKIIDDMPSLPKLNTTECRWDGYGHPDKKKYFVARMLGNQVWNNEIPEVAEARRAYEAGTHEMVTGRDGPYIILYSIPRIVKKPNPSYFDLKTEA